MPQREQVYVPARGMRHDSYGDHHYGRVRVDLARGVLHTDVQLRNRILRPQVLVHHLGGRRGIGAEHYHFIHHIYRCPMRVCDVLVLQLLRG